MKAEGWHVDPYGVHQARWISDGTPTELVRDGGAVSHHPPPSTPYTGRLEPIVEAEGESLHAHGDEGRSDGGSGVNAVTDIFIARGGD